MPHGMKSEISLDTGSTPLVPAEAVSFMPQERGVIHCQVSTVGGDCFNKAFAG